MTFREALAFSLFDTGTKGVLSKLNSEQRIDFFMFLDSIKFKDIFLQVHLAIKYIEQNFDFEQIENEDKKEVSGKLELLKKQIDKTDTDTYKETYTEKINENNQNNKTANGNVIPWNEHYGGKHF